MDDFLYKDEGYKILGACFEVYNTLLPGLSEDIYKLSLGVEFGLRGIPYEREKALKTYYKGVLLPKIYYADIVCYGKIILEAKAVSCLTDDHRGQLLNYMRITNVKVGYLINFGAKDKLQWQRMALSGQIVERSSRNKDIASFQEKMISGNLRESAVGARGSEEPQVGADSHRLKGISGNLRESAVDSEGM